jgi:hypothetical protein
VQCAKTAENASLIRGLSLYNLAEILLPVEIAPFFSLFVAASGC